MAVATAAHAKPFGGSSFIQRHSQTRNRHGSAAVLSQLSAAPADAAPAWSQFAPQELRSTACQSLLHFIAAPTGTAAEWCRILPQELRNTARQGSGRGGASKVTCRYTSVESRTRSPECCGCSGYVPDQSLLQFSAAPTGTAAEWCRILLQERRSTARQGCGRGGASKATC